MKRRKTPDVFDDCDAWYTRLVTFITAKLGVDYYARLGDSSGMTFYSSLPQSGEKQKMEYEKRREEKMQSLQAKMQRLNEFISELASS